MLQDPGVGHDTLVEGTGEGSLWCQGVFNGHHRCVKLTRPDTEVGLERKRRREKSEGRDRIRGRGGGRAGRRGGGDVRIGGEEGREGRCGVKGCGGREERRGYWEGEGRDRRGG